VSIVSFLREERSRIKDVNTANTTDEWARFNAMTEEQRHEAALSDPDAFPMTEEELDNAPLTPRVKVLRRALELSQEEFSSRYCIPLGTLRDWEQGRSESGPSLQFNLQGWKRRRDAMAFAPLHMFYSPPNYVYSKKLLFVSMVYTQY
jgi:putative transcriptional regulator